MPAHWVNTCRPQARRILCRQRGERIRCRQDRMAAGFSDARLSLIWKSSCSSRWLLVAVRLRWSRARTERPCPSLPFSISHLGDSGRNHTPQTRIIAGTAWKESGKRQEKAPPRRVHPYPTHCLKPVSWIITKCRRDYSQQPRTPSQSSIAAYQLTSPESVAEQPRSGFTSDKVQQPAPYINLHNKRE